MNQHRNKYSSSSINRRKILVHEDKEKVTIDTNKKATGKIRTKKNSPHSRNFHTAMLMSDKTQVVQ